MSSAAQDHESVNEENVSSLTLSGASHFWLSGSKTWHTFGSVCPDRIVEVCQDLVGSVRTWGRGNVGAGGVLKLAQMC